MIQEVPQELQDGANLDILRSNPGFEELRKLLDKLAGDAVLAMLSCPQADLLEWRGRVQAYFSVTERIHAGIRDARELAARIRRETEEVGERERASLEQEIERRQREAQTIS